VIARNVSARGVEGSRIAADLGEKLAGEGVRLVVAFVDSRVDDVAAFARELQRRVDAPVVGCTAIAVVDVTGADRDAPISTAVGFYGDWLRVGVGVATELVKSPIVRSREAVRRAAAALRTSPEALDPRRHVVFTLVDRTGEHDDAFCIGSAAAVPQLKVIGGVASADLAGERPRRVFAQGEAFGDAGVAVLLESRRRFEAFSSQHMVPTELKTVITAVAERSITELDGKPAGERLRELLATVGMELDAPRPTRYTFARYVDGVPYVRSIIGIDGNTIAMAVSVEPGHVMRVMRTGDLIGTTRADLAAVANRVGGIEALLAWSCLSRHWEADASGLSRELAAAYSAYPTTGYCSMGEQTGMLLVNYTLCGLAIGAPSS
jgi:hypothetical protein